MKKTLSILLVCVMLCGLVALTAHAESDKISKPLQNKLEVADPDETLNIVIWLNYGDVEKPAQIKAQDYWDGDGEFITADAANAYIRATREQEMNFHTENNQRIINVLSASSEFEVIFLSRYSPLAEIHIKAIDVEKLAQSDSVGAVYLEDPAEYQEPTDPIMDKIETGLQSVISSLPEREIFVAVERVVDLPKSIEDMPAYVDGDRESYVAARRQLASYNKGLNEDFIKELSQYADFEVKINTNTTIVSLKIKAKDVYELAKCRSVLAIDYISEQKATIHAGIGKLLGDADSDSTVTILDATKIQRELADLGVSVFDEEAADYDQDGDVTILDATGIQRTIADLG